ARATLLAPPPLCRSAGLGDLLLCAKHLFVEAMATSLSPGSEAGASLLFGRCGGLGNQSLQVPNFRHSPKVQAIFFRRRHQPRRPLIHASKRKSGWSARSMMLLLQRRNALAQFVYDIVEMTGCIFEAILEAINSIRQACISALRGRLCRSIWHD